MVVVVFEVPLLLSGCDNRGQFGGPGGDEP